MERLGKPLRPASSQYQRLGRSESLDRLLDSAAWANEIEPAARDKQMPPPPPPKQQQGRGRLLRTRSLPDLLGLRRRAAHWKALSWFLDPAGGRRKVGSLEYLKDMGKVPAGSGDQSCRRPTGNVTFFSKSTEAGGGAAAAAAAEDDKHRRKKQGPKNKKRSSWLPDPDRRWPIQGW